MREVLLGSEGVVETSGPELTILVRSHGHVLGMDKGYYQITNDFITDLVRSQTRGAVPMNNTLWDIILSIIGFVSRILASESSDTKVNCVTDAHWVRSDRTAHLAYHHGWDGQEARCTASERRSHQYGWIGGRWGRRQIGWAEL